MSTTELEEAPGENSALGRFLAILIRAAMKPWTWVVVILLAAIIAPVVWVQMSIARIPDIGEPFDVAAMRAVTVPDDQNAFTVYRQATPLFIYRKQSNDLSTSLDASLDRGWSAANDDLRKWLEINRHALELWREGTERNDAVEIQPRDLEINSLLPATQASRIFVHFALLEADRLAEAGHPQEAWEWHRAALRSGRHVGMHATSIGRLVGASIQHMSTKPILRWASRPDVSADILRTALEDVQEIHAMTPPASEYVKLDYIAVFAAREEEWIAVAGGSSGKSAFPIRLSKLSGFWERARRFRNLVVANWLTQCDRPRGQRASFRAPYSLDLFIPDPGAPADPKLLPPARIAEIYADYMNDPIAVRFHLPNTTSSGSGLQADLFDREAAAQRALELALALELFHREQGEFPATLEPLLNGYLKEIPADPLGKGEPLRYRREPDGGATVWSIGQDGIDQDGKIERTNRNADATLFDDVFHIAAPKK